MSLIDETKHLERRSFFASERLFDADLNDQESFHREMRWLHNRSLHQPGVGNGYKIVGTKGDREVFIGAGYALDALGREIILTRDMMVPIPPVAGEDLGRPAFYYLAVSYPDDSRLDEAEVREGVCGSRGAVRLTERPVLCWARLAIDSASPTKILVPVSADLRNQVNTGMLIVLAVVEILQCRLNKDISERSLAPRRSARPPKLPYTASGVEAHPAWIVEPIAGLTPPAAPTLPALLLASVRLRATVRVTTATFGAVPRYLVRVEGDRLLPADLAAKPGSKAGHVYAEPQVEVLLDPNRTDHTKFAVQVSLLVYVPDQVAFDAIKGALFDTKDIGQRDALTEHLRKSWSIVWVGIEG